MKHKILTIFMLLFILTSVMIFFLSYEEKSVQAFSDSIQEHPSLSFHTDDFEHSTAYGTMSCNTPYDNVLGQASEKTSQARLKILNESLLPKNERCYRLKLLDENGENNSLSLANLANNSSWELHLADGCEHLSQFPVSHVKIAFYLDEQLLGDYVLISESSQ